MNSSNSSPIKSQQAQQVSPLQKCKPNYSNGEQFQVPTSPQLKQDQRKIGDFIIGPSLGKGKFSEVFIAKDKESGFVVALQKMDKKFIQSQNLEKQIQQEIMIQLKSNHPNILQLYGYFEDALNIYLVLQFSQQGDLYTFIHNQKLQKTNQTLFFILNQPEKYIPENLSVKFIKNVVSALKYLHDNQVIHRDLQPENILISRGEIQLADFGLAIVTVSEEKRQTFCGTLDYISPQMFKRKGHDFKIDVWSLGILIFQLCAGHPPFESDTYQETMNKVCKLDLKYPEHFSSDLKALLKYILVPNPKERPTFDQILQHQWFNRPQPQ